MSAKKHFLTVRGDHLENSAGRTVILRGIGLGGWMNMENFITGYPGNEEAQREKIAQILGPELAAYFFEKFLDAFFTERDADYLKSAGFNALRIPMNYRHFEDDMNPGVMKEPGFERLDRVVRMCAEREIYTILDLHALPGYQNQDWHSDNPTHKALLWKHRNFQDRTVRIWEELARRYAGEAWVAGYNPLNEPADPSEEMIRPFCERLFGAIRAIDPEHVIFFEGNRYSRDFHMFREPWPNVVYTTHDYPAPGRIDGRDYPGETKGRMYDKKVIEQDLLDMIAYMLENRLPVWVGEFGPGYLGEERADGMRLNLLRDQLDIYNARGFSWSAWTYKDIGYQGMVYTRPDSPWMKRMAPVLEKKRKLAADSWTGIDAGVRDVIAPIEELLAREFPGYDPFPFDAAWQVKRLVRNILFSEPILDLFGEVMEGATRGDIDGMMNSFLFENCLLNQKLFEIYSHYAK